ncbi:ABC transporter substrate-binding protein [Paenibacillus sp. J53TS2]|uniref:ABC transporter substrate-binding protein n=1 Tax=Paenibacillus sp. J53TS2 TaxID=2807197 RepID=UPI001BCADDC9|nr:extracellular solute-binding protein [Paenibacillus sp. J53TS2]
MKTTIRMRARASAAAGFFLLFALAACSGGGGETPQIQIGESGDRGSEQPIEAPANAGKTMLTFSTFFPDTHLEELVSQYEALHPEVDIQLQSVQTDNAHLEAEMEKFKTQTNTAMLAGKGPDLLLLDDLPAASYVKNGLLVNFDELIAQDAAFKREDYFTNILDHAKIGGGLYAMPISFFLHGLAGDEEALAQAGVEINDESWSWNDFAALSKQLVNKTYPHVIHTEPQYMLNWMVSDNLSLFVDEPNGTAKFNTATFTGLMKQVQKMSEDGVIGAEGTPYFFPVQINSPGDYFESLNSFLSSNMKLYVKPHAQDVGAGGYFQPYRSIGLNESSKAKEQAWDFVKFMISDQVPVDPNHAGFPLNKRLYAQEVEQLKKDGSVPTAKEGPLKGVPIQVNSDELDALESELTGAIHLVSKFQPDQLSEIIMEQSQAFFSGQKSAEDVAGLIQNKVTTYLNE